MDIVTRELSTTSLNSNELCSYTTASGRFSLDSAFEEDCVEHFVEDTQKNSSCQATDGSSAGQSSATTNEDRRFKTLRDVTARLEILELDFDGLPLNPSLKDYSYDCENVDSGFTAPPPSPDASNENLNSLTWTLEHTTSDAELEESLRKAHNLALNQVGLSNTSRGLTDSHARSLVDQRLAEAGSVLETLLATCSNDFSFKLRDFSYEQYESIFLGSNSGWFAPPTSPDSDREIESGKPTQEENLRKSNSGCGFEEAAVPNKLPRLEW